MKKRIFILIFLFFLMFLLSHLLYDEVKKNTLQDFANYQRMLAKQAARNIENIFNRHFAELSYLASRPEVINFTEEGKKLLMRSYSHYPQDEVMAITRVDSHGKIIYTYPYDENVINKDISNQKHIQKITKLHLPVISDVFTTVQGYKAVAFHVPVISQGKYQGTIAILIPFNAIAKKNIETIKIGADGFSFIISNEGTTLFCHNGSHIGASAYEKFGKNKGGKRILDNMLAGGEGSASFSKKHFDNYKEKNRRYQAYYTPVNLQNTAWSILVAASEPHILSALTGLRNKLLLIVIAFFILSLVYVFTISKAWHVLQSEKRRKKAEEKIEKYKNFLNNIIDSMPSILIGIDKSGKIMQWNKRAEDRTGIEASEAIGKEFSLIMPQFEGEMDNIKKAISKQKIQIQEKVARKEKDSTIFENIAIFPLVASGVEAAVIRIDDVTEQAKMQEMILQTEKMASVGGLAAGMAHEINNPLAGIMQNIQVLRNRLKADIAKNKEVAKECGTTMEVIQKYMRKRDIFTMINSILESGERASNIVANMLGFSRKSTARFQEYDLVQLLNKTVRLLENDYDLKKHIDFTLLPIVRKFEDNLPKVECEGQTLQQVFLNLLKNSAHALADMEDKVKSPQIILKIFKKGQVIRIEIEDNGPGIASKDLKRIFEPFYTTKEVGNGTGLGLSVSYFIITERHGGTMGVSSELGKFTKFTISLPIKRKK